MGSPRIVQADIGIFIELPEPVRVVLLGQVSVALPRAENAVIELHLDVLGEINFENETLSIDATLNNSRIYRYPLTGDAAVRWSWGIAQRWRCPWVAFIRAFRHQPDFRL